MQATKNVANKSTKLDTGIKANAAIKKPSKAETILALPSDKLTKQFKSAWSAFERTVGAAHAAMLAAFDGYMSVGGAISDSPTDVYQWVLMTKETPSAGQRTALSRAIKQRRDELGFTPVARGAAGGRVKSELDSDANDSAKSTKQVKHNSIAQSEVVTCSLELLLQGIAMRSLNDLRVLEAEIVRLIKGSAPM